MKKLKMTTGKRKRAIARATAVAGTGKVIINGIDLEAYEPEVLKLMIKEPLIIGESSANKLDFKISTKGGGVFGQSAAIRQAIAKMIVQHDKKLKDKFLDYDRTMLVADIRRTEPHKPSRSSTGSRRHKQRSKR